MEDALCNVVWRITLLVAEMWCGRKQIHPASMALKCGKEPSGGRVALGHPQKAMIGEPINGQADCAKEFDIPKKIMWMSDGLLLIRGQFRIAGFL